MQKGRRRFWRRQSVYQVVQTRVKNGCLNQTAKKIIKEQLSEEERKEFEDEVQKWKTAGVPSEVRAE